MGKLWSRVRKEERGIAAVEFAVIAPVFLVILMGGFEIGYTLYVESVLNGQVQKAARDSSLETGGDATVQAAIDTRVRNALANLNNSATVSINRSAYQDFTKAQAQQPEDSNGNGLCEAGETWLDRNYNGVYDADGGSAGQGGAKDAVVYTVSMSYERLFPVAKLIGLSPDVTLTARTVLANQPFGDQAVFSGTQTPQACP